MKKLLTLSLVLVGIAALAACNGEDEDLEAVRDARDNLMLTQTDDIQSDMWVPAQGRNDTSITWESDNEDVVSVTDEVEGGEVRLAVTQPDEGEGDVWVTLNATVSKGDAEAERSFEVRIVEYAGIEDLYETIAELHELDAGEEVAVEGIVTNINNHNSFFIEDESGGIGVYDPPQDYIGDLSIGDRIEIAGSRSNFEGLRQIGFIETVNVLDSGVDLPDTVDMDDVDFEDEEVMDSYQGQRGTVSEMTVVDLPDLDEEGGQYNIGLERDDGKRIDMRYDGRLDDSTALFDALVELEEGDTIALNGPTLGWHQGPQFLLGDEEHFDILE